MNPRSERSRRYRVYAVAQGRWGYRPKMVASFDSLDQASRYSGSLPETETFIKDANTSLWSGYVVHVRTGGSYGGRQAGRFGSFEDAIRYAEGLPADDVYIRDTGREDPVTVWEKLHYKAWAKQPYKGWSRLGFWWRQGRFKELEDAIGWAEAQGTTAVITDENQPGRRRVWEKREGEPPKLLPRDRSVDQKALSDRPSVGRRPAGPFGRDHPLLDFVTRTVRSLVSRGRVAIAATVLVAVVTGLVLAVVGPFAMPRHEGLLRLILGSILTFLGILALLSNLFSRHRNWGIVLLGAVCLAAGILILSGQGTLFPSDGGGD